MRVDQWAAVHDVEEIVSKMASRIEELEEAVGRIARYELGKKYIGEEAVTLKQIARSVVRG